MSDLQIVKEEPTEPSHSHSPNPKSIPNTTSTNTNTLSLIPPLPSNIAHTNTVTTPLPPPHSQSNPFGPTHYTHASPPFSTYYPHGPPVPPGPPPMPFQAPPFPNTDVTTHNRYTPATHPMFYPPVFHYNQPPPPPSHYNDNNDASSSSNHGTPQPNPTATNTNNNNNNVKKSENINSNKTGAKPYSFTPGMQPGAYYLIPLQTANGQVDNVHNAYMPLINSEKNNNNNNKNDSDISSTTSDSDSSHSSDNHDTNRHNNNHNNNQPLFAAQPPFLNAQIPHLPLPIPLTPNGNNGQFPPPPIPLPYTDINNNHNQNTQFSLQPILNNHNGNGNVNEKNNGNERNRNEDKKNIIKHKNNAALQTSFMMQQPTNINNINPNQSTQPLSFPPLPTNNSMTQSNNINHLNSNFAGTDLSENIEGAPMLTPERGDSSDQDMDVALGRNINNIMPIIQQNNENTNTNNNSYYHITPFQEDKNKKKLKNKRNKSPKKSIKKIRKHSTKKKVSNKIPSNATNAYQDISVPALNKMNVSSHKLAHKATTNGRRITRKKNKNTKKQKINDIPDLSDHENNNNTNNSTKTKKKSKKNASISIPPPINNDVVEGQMEVAYSQQYPQVGFPYIYNSEADKGKKFTCKFMDSALSMVDGEPQFCDRQFGQKCHWMRHCLEKHVPTEMSQRYQCRYCNMKYAQNSSLKEHVAICHSNKPPSFKCPYCSGDITFTRWTSVLRHCRNQHPDQEEPKKIKINNRRNNNMHNNNNNNNSNNNRKRKRGNNRKKNTNNNRRVRRNHNNNNNGHGMDIDSHGNLSAMNIMPSVNMNISMNQMLSSNNYIVPANVAILPPDLSHHNGGIR